MDTSLNVKLDPAGTADPLTDNSIAIVDGAVDGTAVAASSSTLAATQVGGGSAVGGTTITYGTVGRLRIQVSYDTSVNNAPAGFQTGFEAAINYFTSTFTNNVQIDLNAGWGEVTFGGNSLAVGSLLGRSRWAFDNSTYSQIRTALGNHTGSANQHLAFSTLPTFDPLGANYIITTAEERALGLLGGNAEDGGVGFNSSDTYTFDPNNRAVSGAFDFIGIAEHEISEVLGRDAAVGTTVGTTSIAAFPIDLFRYSAVNTRTTASTENPSYFSINSGFGDLKNWNNASLASGDLGDWAATTPYTADAFNDVSNPGVVNAVTAVDTELLNVMGYDIACFCRGTMILTDKGEMPVEDLAVGERVITLSGAVKPIVWIGIGRDLVTRANKLAQPVIVRAGALAEGVPHRDLYLTHGHALYLEGALIPVEHLINHRSILWDEKARVVEYYHVELEDHDVLLAEGAPAESYYDANNRGAFHNAPREAAGAVKPTFAPVLHGGDIVETVWAQLFARAGGSLESRVTDEPDLHLLADGQRINPAMLGQGTYRFDVERPPAATLVLRSRCGVPSLVGHGRSDHRPLGVAITQIVIEQADIATCLDYDQPQLGEAGCYCHEDGFCWTDGELALPTRFLPPLATPFTLTVRTEPHPDMRYLLAAAPAQAA